MEEKKGFTEETNNENIPTGTENKKHGMYLGEILESVAIAVILAVIIRFFLFQPFYIPSGSMEPTLKPGDRIIVNKLIYRYSQPERGDIMVFKYPRDPARDFIKRAVGLPEETVEIKDSKVYINDKKISQPFLEPGLQFGSFGPVEVPGGSYFMMGDNRNNSEDSRIWGTLPGENIVGKAMFIYWPISRIGLIK